MLRLATEHRSIILLFVFLCDYHAYLMSSILKLIFFNLSLIAMALGLKYNKTYLYPLIFFK